MIIITIKKSIQALNKFEREFNLTLPKAYRDFIVNPDVFNYEDGFYSKDLEYVPIERMPVMGSAERTTMDLFVEPIELAELMDSYTNRFHEALVPIVSSSFGDLICLGVSGEFTGRVYYWDHENELEAKLMLGMETTTDDINEYWDNLYLIANSFTEFVNGLTIEPVVPNLQPIGRIIASGDFLSRLTPDQLVRFREKL